jgi:hypothetical protein
LGFDIVMFQVGIYEAAVGYANVGSPEVAQVEAFTTEAINKLEGKPVSAPAVPDDPLSNEISNSASG